MFPIMQQNKFSNTDTFWYCVVDFLGKETQGLRLKNEFTGGANYIWTRGGLVNVKGPGSDLRQNGVKQEKKPEVIKYLFHPVLQQREGIQHLQVEDDALPHC